MVGHFGDQFDTPRRSLMPSREICKLCWHVNAIGYRVPDHVWSSVVPEAARNSVVCLACFVRLADELSIAWDHDIEFYPVSLATHLKHRSV